jgi:hypothetical protein
LLKALDALPGRGKFVRHSNRQHDDQCGISSLAAFAAQTIYSVIDVAGEIHKVAFVTIPRRSSEIVGH